MIPCTRVAEARAISLDLVRRSHPRFAVTHFGEVLNGQVLFYADGIHPGIRFAGVWPDMILHRCVGAMSRQSLTAAECSACSPEKEVERVIEDFASSTLSRPWSSELAARRAGCRMRRWLRQ